MEGLMKRVARTRTGITGRWKSSFINTGVGPNQQALREYHERADGVRRNDFEMLCKHLERIFGRGYVERVLRINVWSANRINENLEEIKKKIEKMLNNTPLERHVVLVDAKRKKVTMFFDETGTKYFFVMVKALSMRKSYIYDARETAMFAFEHGHVEWQAEEDT
jgi:hypothetical protein